MAECAKSSGVRVGFFGLLALVFITLKLTGHVSWPWLWVLTPLWFPAAVVVLVVVVAVALLGIAGLIDHLESKRRKG